MAMTSGSLFQKGTFIDCSRSQLALDLEQAIVFCEPLASRQRSGLDLSPAHGNREISDERVLGFTRSVRNHVSPTGVAAHRNGLDRLGDGADLVQLDEHRIGRATLDALLDETRVGNVEIVAHDLYPIAAGCGLPAKAFPIVLGKAILDRNDRIDVNKAIVESEQLVAREDVVARFGKDIPAVFREGACRRIERNRNVAAGAQTRLADRGDE